MPEEACISVTGWGEIPGVRLGEVYGNLFGVVIKGELAENADCKTVKTGWGRCQKVKGACHIIVL